MDGRSDVASELLLNRMPLLDGLDRLLLLQRLLLHLSSLVHDNGIVRLLHLHLPPLLLLVLLLPLSTVRGRRGRRVRPPVQVAAYAV